MRRKHAQAKENVRDMEENDYSEDVLERKQSKISKAAAFGKGLRSTGEGSVQNRKQSSQLGKDKGKSKKIYSDSSDTEEEKEPEKIAKGKANSNGKTKFSGRQNTQAQNKKLPPERFGQCWFIPPRLFSTLK